MDSVEKLTSAITMVEEARGVPLSASCVVHRGEMLEILDGARASLPTDLEDAEAIISSRDSIIEDGEVILNKTMDAVARGRDRLAGANDKDVLSQLADEN